MNQELRFSEEGEALVGKYFKVLDKGFVGLINYMGTDKFIEFNARQSYQQGTRTVNETRGLIRSLIRRSHTTPLEHVKFTFGLKVPLYIATQILRHRTAKFSEFSTFSVESHRYSEVKDEFHFNTPGQWRLQNKKNKQGSDGLVTEHPESASELKQLITPQKYLSKREEEIVQWSKELYEELLEYGVAREQARKVLPYSAYTTFSWTIDLHNLFHFMSLRSKPEAQEEVQCYSNIIASIVKAICPLAFEAWVDYNFCKVEFSRHEFALLNKILTHLVQDNSVLEEKELAKQAEDLPLSKTELQEFAAKLTKSQSLEQFDICQYEEIKPC